MISSLLLLLLLLFSSPSLQSSQINSFNQLRASSLINLNSSTDLSNLIDGIVIYNSTLLFLTDLTQIHQISTNLDFPSHSFISPHIYLIKDAQLSSMRIISLPLSLPNNKSTTRRVLITSNVNQLIILDLYNKSLLESHLQLSQLSTINIPTSIDGIPSCLSGTDLNNGLYLAGGDSIGQIWYTHLPSLKYEFNQVFPLNPIQPPILLKQFVNPLNGITKHPNDTCIYVNEQLKNGNLIWKFAIGNGELKDDGIIVLNWTHTSISLDSLKFQKSTGNILIGTTSRFALLFNPSLKSIVATIDMGLTTMTQVSAIDISSDGNYAVFAGICYQESDDNESIDWQSNKGCVSKVKLGILSNTNGIPIIVSSVGRVFVGITLIVLVLLI